MRGAWMWPWLVMLGCGADGERATLYRDPARGNSLDLASGAVVPSGGADLTLDSNGMLVGNMMDLATGQHTGALAPDEDRAFLVRARSGCPARAKVTDRDVDGDYLAAVEVEWIAEPCATVGITMQVDRTECPGGLFGFPPPYPQIFIEGGWGFLQAGLEPPAFGTFRFAADDTVLVTAIGPSNAIASFAGDCDEIDGTRCTFTIVDSDRNIVATYRLIPPCNAP